MNTKNFTTTTTTTTTDFLLNLHFLIFLKVLQSDNNIYFL